MDPRWLKRDGSKSSHYGGSSVGHHGRIQVWPSLEDPGWVKMGGSRVGHHGRIQAGSLWEDPGWVIMEGSRVGHHGRIQGG